MFLTPSSLDPSSLMPWGILPGLGAPMGVVRALYAAVADRLRADPSLAPYADALIAEEFSATHYVWLATAPVAKLLELGEALAADDRVP